MKRNFLLYLANNLIAIVPSHALRLWFCRRYLRLEIGANTSILMRAWFDDVGKVRIGANTVINESCRLDNRGGITIGNNVSISRATTILSADHDIRLPDFPYRERGVTIEDYAFLGTNCTILPGVRIGRGAVVAAGAVVSRSVDELTIVAGNPAKPVGRRPPDALAYELRYFPAMQ